MHMYDGPYVVASMAGSPSHLYQALLLPPCAPIVRLQNSVPFIEHVQPSVTQCLSDADR